jgi:competence protein ComGC
MTTINLYQKHKEPVDGPALNKDENGGLIFSISILVVTIVVAIALEIYVPNAEKKNDALDKKIEAENVNLAGLKQLEQITDTKRRLEAISGNLEIKNGKVGRTEMSQILSNLSEDMSKGAFVSQYAYANGKVVVKMMANNFNEVSRQIFNFKKSTNFSDINVLRVARGEDNVEFDVEMRIIKK